MIQMIQRLRKLYYFRKRIRTIIIRLKSNPKLKKDPHDDDEFNLHLKR